MLGLLAVSMIGHAAQQDENKRADKVEVTTNHSQTTPATSASMADGEVEDVDVAGKNITLKHGPIKTKTLDMGPMTMPFVVANSTLLSGVKVGDKVKFTAEYIDEVATITVLKVSK